MNHADTQTSPQNNSFISEDEYVVATLSNRLVSNILSGEGFKTEGAVLTNKRLYYTHKKGILNLRTQEELVNVNNITGSKISNYDPFGILILAVIMWPIGLILTVMYKTVPPVLICLVLSCIFLVVYLLKKKSHLRIEYGGGAIFFSVRKYELEDIIHFQNSIYLVKDTIESNTN